MASNEKWDRSFGETYFGFARAVSSYETSFENCCAVATFFKFDRQFASNEVMED